MNKGNIIHEYIFFRPAAYGSNARGDIMANAQTIMVHKQLPLMFEHFTVMYTQTPQEKELMTTIEGQMKKDIRGDSDDKRAENNRAGANRIVQIAVIQRET